MAYEVQEEHRERNVVARSVDHDAAVRVPRAVANHRAIHQHLRSGAQTNTHTRFTNKKQQHNDETASSGK